VGGTQRTKVAKKQLSTRWPGGVYNEGRKQGKKQFPYPWQRKEKQRRATKAQHLGGRKWAREKKISARKASDNQKKTESGEDNTP